MVLSGKGRVGEKKMATGGLPRPLGACVVCLVWCYEYHLVPKVCGGHPWCLPVARYRPYRLCRGPVLPWPSPSQQHKTMPRSGDTQEPKVAAAQWVERPDSQDEQQPAPLMEVAIGYSSLQ